MHGQGKMKFASGNEYEGGYEDGRKHGAAFFRWDDGELEALQNEKDARVGEGVRWSVDRKRAWRLQAGEPVEEISLEEGAAVVRRLQLAVPEDCLPAGAGGGRRRRMRPSLRNIIARRKQAASQKKTLWVSSGAAAGSEPGGSAARRAASGHSGRA